MRNFRFMIFDFGLKNVRSPASAGPRSGNLVGALCAALLLLAFIPRANGAGYSFSYNLDIVTNYPGSTYAEARADIQSILPGGARWGIVSLCGTTNVHGYVWPYPGLYGPALYVISLLTMKNYYVPIQPEVMVDNDGSHTYYYIPYSNTLSITASGPATPIAWSLSGPAEFANSAAYRASGTGSTSLVAVPTGTYSIVALPAVRGYAAPPNPATNITGASPLINTLDVVYVPYSNNLAVIVAGITSGTNCVWTLTGPAAFTNAVSYGTVFTNTFTVTAIPTGLYTVTFPAVAGYSTPAVSSTNITDASPLVNSIGGIYLPLSNSFTVRFQPQATQPTAKYWVDNVAFPTPLGPYGHNILASLAVSNDYTVTFGAVRGYQFAASMTLTNFVDSRILTNTFIPYSNSLTVTVAGNTSGSNSIWNLVGPAEFTNAISFGTTFSNSFTVIGIPTGLYTVIFSAIPSYTSPPAASTNITEASPLINNLTGVYAKITWSPSTNIPTPPPTNFPVQTNAITLMVDNNGLFMTPSREKIIEANGLLTNGAIGTQGPQGEPGLTGAKGDTGAQGPAGTNGADGAAGPQGPAGSNGVDGATGPQGQQGPAGTNGVAGAQGPQGPAGTNGADGAQGPIGPQGPHGNNGATGPQGPQGEPGLTGAKGDTGAHGAKGDQGVPGSNGVDGATGPQGAPGTNGATGAQGPQGVPGSNGVDGAVGPQGPPGTNGMDGAIGPQGPAGTNGADGATGPQGPPGPAGSNGVDGAVGPQGPQGPPGTNNITGPQGPPGTNGADGATGPQGPQGPAGSNGVDGAVGPQGPAGTNGVDGAVGPQGPAGTNGADGAQGPQGPAGTNGVDGAVGPQGPAGPVTNQVITYLGIAYTITNDPASTGDILRFNSATSNAWFAAETWKSGELNGKAGAYYYNTLNGSNYWITFP